MRQSKIRGVTGTGILQQGEKTTKKNLAESTRGTYIKKPIGKYEKITSQNPSGKYEKNQIKNLAESTRKTTSKNLAESTRKTHQKPKDKLTF